jgi:hypothetical protein
MKAELYRDDAAPAPPGASSCTIAIGMLSDTPTHVAFRTCRPSSSSGDEASGSRQKNTTATTAAASTTRSLPTRSAIRPVKIMTGISSPAHRPAIQPIICAPWCRSWVTYSETSME